MVKNLKKYEYLTLTRYCLLGLVVAVLVFQFVTISLTDHSLRFEALWATETFIRLISTLIGGLFGGLVFLLFPQNELVEIARWKRLKNKGELSFILVYVFAFSFGLFVGGLVLKALDMETYDHFFASLFSPENAINHIGRIIAAAVFGLFFGLGMIKRMKKLYGKL